MSEKIDGLKESYTIDEVKKDIEAGVKSGSVNGGLWHTNLAIAKTLVMILQDLDFLAEQKRRGS